MTAFFYDTWAFAALTNRRDGAHETAAALDRELEQRGYAAVTSDYVLDEAITLVHAAAGARASLALLDAVRARSLGGELLLAHVDEVRRERAASLFRKLAPEEPRLSFTDATSFALMRELGIELAFTADRHFHRAGGAIRPLVAKRGTKWVSTFGP